MFARTDFTAWDHKVACLAHVTLMAQMEMFVTKSPASVHAR